ncbi:hypothetical protein ANN_27522, partial [Periplaneta americana]
LCDLTCDRYHITQCKKRDKPIIEYSKNATVIQAPVQKKAKPSFDNVCHAKRRDALEAKHKTKKAPTKDKLTNYSQKRKDKIAGAKDRYNQRTEENLIERAEKEPFSILKHKSRRSHNICQ